MICIEYALVEKDTLSKESTHHPLPFQYTSKTHLGLQIAMDDAPGVQVLDGIEELPGVPPRQTAMRPHHLLLRSEGAPQIAVGVVQLLQEVQAGVVLEGVVEGDDVAPAGIVAGIIGVGIIVGGGGSRGRRQPILQHPPLHPHLVVHVGMLPLGQLLHLLLLDDLEGEALVRHLVRADDDAAEVALPDLGVQGELADGGGAGLDREVLRWGQGGGGGGGCTAISLQLAPPGQGHPFGVAEEPLELRALHLEGVAPGHLLVVVRRQHWLGIVVLPIIATISITFIII